MNPLFEIESHTLVDMARKELRAISEATYTPQPINKWQELINVQLQESFSLKLLGLNALLSELFQRGVKNL